MWKWVIGAGAGLLGVAGLLAWRGGGRTGVPLVGGKTGSGSTRRGRVHVVNGQLATSGIPAYTITSTDKLWLGRALVGETGGRARRDLEAVTWALAQNFVLVIGAGNRRPRFSTFTDCIRAYSQPVNPRWIDPNGVKCRQHPGACTERHIARRRRISSMSWSSLPQATRQAVDDFVAGRLDNPVPNMVDFAAYTFSGREINIGGNWFGTSEGRRLA
jgi:hypothetical protein